MAVASSSRPSATNAPPVAVAFMQILFGRRVGWYRKTTPRPFEVKKAGTIDSLAGQFTKVCPARVREMSAIL